MDSIAQKMLYSHFKSKGYYNSEDLTGAKELMHTDLVVDFNNIYLLELYESKSVNAIITYWITPPYASGHCFQLQKAIVRSTTSGYLITDEGFIPENFTIDSVIQGGGKVIIYGYEYDCGDRKILRHYRAILE